MFEKNIFFSNVLMHNRISFDLVETFVERVLKIIIRLEMCP